MTLLALDHRIFGNGFGMASPYFDARFYWLNGELYQFHEWLGAQLFSYQWWHPRPGERRKICGEEFSPLHSERRWGRVRVSWAWTRLPKELNEANAALRELGKVIGRPGLHFQWPSAQAIEAGTAKTAGLGPQDDSAVGKADASMNTYHKQQRGVR